MKVQGRKLQVRTPELGKVGQEQKSRVAGARGHVSSRLALRFTSPSAMKALEERCAERLLDNEALGGNKTDTEYEPMLDSAMRRLHQRAQSLVGTSAAKAQASMDRLTTQLADELRMPRAEWDVRTRLEESFAERLLDNEALAGDRTDAEYAPALYRALEQLHEKAFTVERPGSPAAKAEMEAFFAQVKAELKAGG